MQRGNLGSGACSWVLETAVAAMACGRLVQFKYMVMPGVVCGNKNADAPPSEACLGRWMRRHVGVHCMTGTHAVHAYRVDCMHGAPPQRLGAPTPAGHVSAGSAHSRACRHALVPLHRAVDARAWPGTQVADISGRTPQRIVASAGACLR